MVLFPFSLSLSLSLFKFFFLKINSPSLYIDCIKKEQIGHPAKCLILCFTEVGNNMRASHVNFP